MWTATHRDEFEERGFTRIEATFDNMAAGRMRDVAWRELERRYGVTRPGTGQEWPSFIAGLKTTKRHPTFEAMRTPALAAAMDDLLGSERWAWPKQWGQVMVTAPKPETTWKLPHHLWHVDFPYTMPADRLVAVKVFVFFGDVEPRGGGTLLIERSHAMTARYIGDFDVEERSNYRRVRDTFLRHDPWLRALIKAGDDDPRRAERFMEQTGEVDGTPTRVVELAGKAGDIVLTHPWVYHCAAPNATATPRFMRGTGIRRR